MSSRVEDPVTVWVKYIKGIKGCKRSLLLGGWKASEIHREMLWSLVLEEWEI